MMDDKNKPGDEIEFIPEPPPAGETPPRKAPEPPAAEPKETDGKAAAAEGSRHLKEKLKKKEAEAKDLRRELDELKETSLRRLADMENLRKRFDRERTEFQQYALSGLLLELLDVNDNFERALQSASTDGEGRTFREGVELIFRMFQSLLAKNGVRPIEFKDRSFDPNFHHAMTVEESEEVREPEVVEELQKGYMHHDRLLRPALVRVRVPKKGQ
jgi:molecular chaperone GrpE